MRILYTLDSGIIGGMEMHVNDLIKAMINENHEVFVWCREGEISNWFEDAGAQVFHKKIIFDICPKYIFSLRKFLKDQKIDVVHAHELKAAANTLIAASLAGTKVKISHIHTPISEWQIPNKIKEVITFFTIKFYAWLVNMFSSKEIALTQSRKKVKIKEGIKEEKLEIIPNGIDISQFDISLEQKNIYRSEILSRYYLSENAFIIGNVGRITEEKGHVTLVEAFSKFFQYLSGDQKKKTYLFLVGGGKLEDEIKELTAKLGISDNVIITGIFSNEDKIKFYSVIDLFAFPSLAEGFGLVLIEAMVSKIPVICSNLPVLYEVGANTVTYFETGNAQDLSEKIRKYYNSEITPDVQRAYERVKNMYSAETFGKNYLNLYKSLLNIS